MDSSTNWHPLDPMQTASIWRFLQVSVVAPSTMVTPWQAIGTGRRASEGNYVFSQTCLYCWHLTKLLGLSQKSQRSGPYTERTCLSQRGQAFHNQAGFLTVKLGLSHMLGLL